MNAKTAVAAAGALALAGVTTLVLFLHLPYGSATNFADAQHQCMQTEDASCAAAAMVSALSWRGIKVSEHTMAVAAGTTRYGTFANTAAQALQKMLGNTYTVTVANQLPAPTPDELLIVEINDNYPTYHMVCADGTGTGWIVNDPLKHAPEVWTVAEMQKSLVAVDANIHMTIIEIKP